MANDLSNIIPKILARGLLALREKTVMPRLVNSDFSTEAKEKGDTIDVPIPTAVATRDVAPSNVEPASVDTTPTKVQIPLDNWRQNDPIHLTDKDLVEVDSREHFLPGQMSEAIRGLARDVNTDLLEEYKGVFGFVDNISGIPFDGTFGVTSATNARKVLNQQRCPPDMRRGVLDFDAEAEALSLPAFADAEKTLSAEVKINGEMGRKYGIDWVADDDVITHVSGTASGVLVDDAGGALVVGDTTIPIDTGTGTAVIGDIITFAGHAQTYAITAASADVSSGNLSIVPGLVEVPANNEAITFKATHVVNLVFHRDAIGFAMRSLTDDAQITGLPTNIMTMQDPDTGLVLRLEVKRQHKQTVWEFDILWGAKLVRAELATRIAG